MKKPNIMGGNGETLCPCLTWKVTNYPRGKKKLYRDCSFVRSTQTFLSFDKWISEDAEFEARKKPVPISSSLGSDTLTPGRGPLEVFSEEGLAEWSRDTACGKGGGHCAILSTHVSGPSQTNKSPAFTQLLIFQPGEVHFSSEPRPVLKALKVPPG